jgi:methylated-DNA-protein-cysteine methyltransferase-like protein
VIRPTARSARAPRHWSPDEPADRDRPCVINRAVYALVREVRKGEVASYGMIASLIPGVGPRQVGSALAALPAGTRVPWHRIVQSAGTIAERPGAAEQRRRLAAEGIAFRKGGAVDWRRHRWTGPSQAWMDRSGRDPHEVMEIVAGW